ncbi:MAG: Gfo/Idh/MocA family oxidoreductase [Xenococcaceae cyanobacterium MO_188.B29]|nr:Gfo/Idh/MocA family oxidoreductase [Xenococcaceae cyanobacterium MO_188.B29]
MKIAIVGCGYVADFYVNNIRSHPDFVIQGVFDRNLQRRDRFCQYYSLNSYPSLEAVVEDSEVEMVLNLTNPDSHFEVSAAVLKSKKHLYTEKPLGMDISQTQALLELAQTNQVRIGCAPCSVLSDTAQTVWKAIVEGVIGKVRLVYANYDDGMIAPRMKPWLWKSESGAPWPAQDEFEVGCTYEHAGYFLTWLAAFFGPARKVTAFSSCQLSDKGIPVKEMAPDFSVGCIEYDDGVVAKVTTGLVAPRDKSLTVIGDDGVIFVRFLRNDREPVFIRKYPSKGNQNLIERGLNLAQSKLQFLGNYLPIPVDNWLLYQQYPMFKGKDFAMAASRKPVDFFRGPQDMKDSIEKNQPHRLSGELGLHIFELIEALQYPERFNYQRVISSEFHPIKPLF